MGSIFKGTGYSFMGWCHPEMPADTFENFEHHLHQARTARSRQFATRLPNDVARVSPEFLRHDRHTPVSSQKQSSRHNRRGNSPRVPQPTQLLLQGIKIP